MQPGTAVHHRSRPCHTARVSWIEREIAARGGRVSFREFMELALYHPERGYYSRGTVRYGRGGDYLTAPTASGWYAAVVARILDRLRAAATGSLRVVDAASGDGAFLAGLLETWGGAPPPGVELVSIERSAALRRLQAERFAGTGVRIVEEAEAAGAWDDGLTVLHASELYDALPVHRVVQRETGLKELAVTVDEGGLGWTETPAAAEITAHLAFHGIELEPGQVAEVCLEAAPLHRRLLSLAGGTGVALVLDYGYTARRLYDPRGRRGGSLACYHRHGLNRDPLLHPGEQDITAHVNWDELRRAAETAGWREVALMPLAELMIRGGIAELADERNLGLERDPDAEALAERQEIKRLLDPDGMGSDLKVLVQATPEAVPAAQEALGVEPTGTPGRRPGR